MTPLRVLHLAQPVDGGVGRVVADIAADQHRRGWEVVVGCPDGGYLADRAAAAGARRVRWDAARAGRAATPAQLRHLAGLMAQVRPDVVHLHSASAGLTGRLVVRRRIPTVFQPHGWSWQAVTGAYARAVQRWERAGARLAHAIVCVSDAERQAGEAAGVRGNLTVIRNGVDTEAFPAAGPGERARARQRLGLGDGPLVVCVGRLDRQKGHETVVRALPALVARVPGARLALVGDGPLAGHLRVLARDLGVAGSVVFAGERPEVAEWYAASDLVAFPSLWGEGMALTPLEAMASGRAVVASDVAGVREVVDGDRGAVVPPGDVAAFADALTERLRDPARLAAEGARARRHAVRSLDAGAAFDRLAEVTAMITERNRRRLSRRTPPLG